LHAGKTLIIANCAALEWVQLGELEESQHHHVLSPPPLAHDCLALSAEDDFPFPPFPLDFLQPLTPDFLGKN
jgi:hypothetical protein